MGAQIKISAPGRRTFGASRSVHVDRDESYTAAVNSKLT
jgi:hypothetical protein